MGIGNSCGVDGQHHNHVQSHIMQAWCLYKNGMKIFLDMHTFSFEPAFAVAWTPILAVPCLGIFDYRKSP